MAQNPFNPNNWYWVVAGSSTQVYSSVSGTFVGVGDATYVAWLGIGNVATAIASNSLLFDVLFSLNALSATGAATLQAAGGLTPTQIDISLTLSTGGQQNNLVAHAGGGQVSGTQCVIGNNIFTVVATSGDSAQLPTAIAGRGIVVFNNGAQQMTIWSKNATTDLLHTTATPSGAAFTTLASGKVGQFGCPQNGHWGTAVVSPTA